MLKLSLKIKITYLPTNLLLRSNLNSLHLRQEESRFSVKSHKIHLKIQQAYSDLLLRQEYMETNPVSEVQAHF